MADNTVNAPREKRLTPEELEKQIARLTAPKREVEVRDPFEVCPTKRISSEQLTKMTDRLYTRSLLQRTERLAEADRAAYGAFAPGTKGHNATLTPEDEEISVKRLYNDSVALKNKNLEQLRERYLYHPPGEPVKVPLGTFVQHMYHDRIEAKKKTEKRLYDLYLAPTEIPTHTISCAQANESANRLCTTR